MMYSLQQNVFYLLENILNHQQLSKMYFNLFPNNSSLKYDLISKMLISKIIN